MNTELSWLIESPKDWIESKATANQVAIEDGGLVLKAGTEGTWTSKWHNWQDVVGSAKILVETEIDLFNNKKIETVVTGNEVPYTDADQIPHDWYGRCMIAIVDENRWIMAIRSGVNHISWGDRDTIHIMTSTNEGRTWSQLNQWFDGTPVEGMPYEDGHTHSEPGLYKMPNGDLILQFWRTDYSSGTKQLRSIDDGKTWVTDIDRIHVTGVTGADGEMAIGTEDYFIDPEKPSQVYMAFQYFHYNSMAGTLLAKSLDNGKSYSFLSWIGSLAEEKSPLSRATFEPAIEYVGKRTIIAVMRDATGNKRTWQTLSTNMGDSFDQLIDISDKINGGVPNGLWQRARLYKESNPYFQYNNPMSYTHGEGRLWGFGLHSNGGGYTRKPVVYWSDDNGQSWNGPQLLHGPIHPGTDTGYGDMKRRNDNTFVATTYYANQDSTVADVEQYTFGGKRTRMMIEVDHDGNGIPNANSVWYEVYNGQNIFCLSSLPATRWRLKWHLSSTDTVGKLKINNVKVTPLNIGSNFEE